MRLQSSAGLMLLQRAKGIFILPTYGRGGSGAGIRGGEGVMLTQSDHRWSNPLFYNLAGVGIGIQGGAEAGSLPMLLMTNKAASELCNTTTFPTMPALS